MTEKSSYGQKQTLFIQRFDDQYLKIKTQPKMTQKITVSENIFQKCEQQIPSQINAEQIIKSTKKWTSSDEQLLIKLHRIFGNRWSKISNQFQNRSQDQIKNRFYSRMRKSVRILNNMIARYQHKQKLLSLNIIFKITNLISFKVNHPKLVTPQVLAYYENFLYTFLEISDDKQLSQSDQSSIHNLILPLKALEGLITFLGESRKTSKKKKMNKHIRNNIFRLNTNSQECLCITKQGCFIKDISQAQKLKKDNKLLNQMIQSSTFQALNESRSSQESQFQNQSEFESQKKLQQKLENSAADLQPHNLINIEFFKEGSILENQNKKCLNKKIQQIQMRIVDEFQSQSGEMDLFDKEAFVQEIYTNLF